MADTDAEHYEKWVAHGRPEPAAAEEVNEGECNYKDCENSADYRVAFEINGEQAATTTIICDSCSSRNRIYVQENGLLEYDVKSS